MFKSLTFLGFCGALLLSIGFAVISSSSGEAGPDNQKSHASLALSCPVIDVAIDEGYGVSRMEKRHQCKELSH
jgi:hypothetical protein